MFPGSLQSSQHTTIEHLLSARSYLWGPQTDGGGRSNRVSLNVRVGEMSAGAPAPGPGEAGLKSFPQTEHPLPMVDIFPGLHFVHHLILLRRQPPLPFYPKEKADTQDICV